MRAATCPTVRREPSTADRAGTLPEHPQMLARSVEISGGPFLESRGGPILESAEVLGLPHEADAPFAECAESGHADFLVTLKRDAG